MSLDWNRIEFEAIKNDPNIAVKIGESIESMSWAKSPFSYFVGKGSDRGIKFCQVNETGPYRPRLKAKLLGTGVRGNANLDTNFDRFEILNQTIYPVAFGNAVPSEIVEYMKMKKINFVQEATQSLTEWAQETRDRAFIANLCNDFTNAVIADQTTGFKDTKGSKNIATETKKLVAGDVMNVKMLERAIFMAKGGVGFGGESTFPLKPAKIDTVTIGGLQVAIDKYIILLESYQAEQLRNDPEWRDLQKHAENRGSNNPLFSGCLGLIRGCPVIDMGTWTKEVVGMPTSDVSDEDFERGILNPQNVEKITPPSFYKPNGVDISIGCLIGASSLILAGSDSMKIIVDDSYDSGRKIIVAVDKIQTIAKTRYGSQNVSEPKLRNFANKDFAVIGLFSTKE
ncbi:MAG: DUF4043 family protein [Helicobacteraceae bacterium]|nr:DUF4043 family protein [Helicobacteraceae bacterium]